MEAPKNIYLTKNLLGELRDGWDALPSEVFTNIEYIRKDAFIEKAATWFANRYQVNGYLDADDIEDFKKYMEE